MPLSSAVVGLSTEPIGHEVDARWTMAYAAALDDLAPCYLDTTAPEPVVAHPLFPVCVEWPSVLAWRRRSPDHGLSRDEAVRGVHADHDLTIHRLVRAGDRLSTTATIERVERRSPGAYQVLRLDTVDERDEPVATTRMGSLFLGVEVEGPDAALPSSPETDHRLAADAPHDRHEITREVAANAAHVYTECSRIWNPIHTDRAVAVAAGLPAPILHGTATMAMAVSEVVARIAPGEPERVRRISGRFAAMVLMPSAITITLSTHHSTEHDTEQGEHVAFTVTNADGATAIRDGLVVVAL